MDPQVNHGDGEKCVEADRETFPADDQAAVLPLEPCKRPLGLEARDGLFDGAPPRLSGFPYTLGDLGPDPASAESMAEVLSIIPFIRRQDPEPFARSALFAGADVEGIQQGEDLRSLIAIRRCCACGQRHASTVRETVDENTFAFPAIRDALTAAFARGKRLRPRHHSATESGPVPRPARAGELASRPGSHRPASAAAIDARRS
jgi:hypothetical protein